MDDSNLNTSAPNFDGTGTADDNNDVYTMVEVMEEEKEWEEDAEAVLGASDAKNCTYPEGYVKRQALYACLTCLPDNGDSSKMAGICLACSYSCHEKHTLVELYTKRNFRCDCGNSLFGDKKCVKFQDKESTNDKNKYNHNFRGTYCICARPYPDPEDEIADSMIQCIICEDWYHCRHLGSPVPPHDEYGEMICKSCMTEHKFLQKYMGLCVTKVVLENTGCSVPNVDGTPTNEKTLNVETSAKVNGSTDEVKGSVESKTKSGDEQVQSVIPNGTSFDTSRDVPTKSDECSYSKMKDMETEVKGATFWPNNWRNHLCSCSDCKKIYAEQGVEFLLDNQDTVHAYEENGKKKGGEESMYDQAMGALQQMGRVNFMEAVLGYNDMMESLKEYLRSFAERKRVVREEDIREFFSSMEARKRRRVDLPHNCR